MPKQLKKLTRAQKVILSALKEGSNVNINTHAVDLQTFEAHGLIERKLVNDHMRWVATEPPPPEAAEPEQLQALAERFA